MDMSREKSWHMDVVEGVRELRLEEFIGDEDGDDDDDERGT